MDNRAVGLCAAYPIQWLSLRLKADNHHNPNINATSAHYNIYTKKQPVIHTRCTYLSIEIATKLNIDEVEQITSIAI